MTIDSILETGEVFEYLRSRNLTKQYQKIKQKIMGGHMTGGAQLRKRYPKSGEVWYFRINQKYRAFAYLDGRTLKVFHIDNHQ